MEDKEEIFKVEHRPLKSLDKGTIIELWHTERPDNNDIVIIPHSNCYTNNGGYLGNRIVGISSKTGSTYKENMGKNYSYKILRKSYK